MKWLTFNSLHIWIILSLIFHLAAIRIIQVERRPEETEVRRYDVNLIYYEPPVREPEISNKLKKKKFKGLRKEKKEAIPEKATEPEPETVTTPEETEVSEVMETPEAPIIPEPEETAEEPVDSGATALPLPAEEAEEIPQTDFTEVMAGLRKSIIEKKVYPYVARKKGFQGIAHVWFKLDENGNLVELKLTRSSGHRVLDNAALSLIRKVVPYEHDLGRDVIVEIPIKYSLQQ